MHNCIEDSSSTFYNLKEGKAQRYKKKLAWTPFQCSFIFQSSAEQVEYSPCLLALDGLTDRNRDKIQLLPTCPKNIVTIDITYMSNMSKEHHHFSCYQLVQRTLLQSTSPFEPLPTLTCSKHLYFLHQHQTAKYQCSYHQHIHRYHYDQHVQKRCHQYHHCHFSQFKSVL